MLVLIAGATGNIGQKLCSSLLARKHSIRGLGRNPSRLPLPLLDCLESFVEIPSYDDIAHLNRACAGVDAVICTYAGLPELQLEAQLTLLRAAEGAGVQRFVADSWNYDWRTLQLGMRESYEPYMCFARQVELTSSIEPIYNFVGILAETLFSVPGHGTFAPEHHGVWDPERKEMQVYGSGHEIWHWTTERDAAEFTRRYCGA